MNDNIFERSPFFADLSAQQLALLKPLFMPCRCKEGDLLFEQGDLADVLYLVVRGEVVVRYKPEDGPEIIVARVRPGGIVGWSAALGSRHYTSGAICSADSELLCVRGSDLRRLCSQYPPDRRCGLRAFSRCNCRTLAQHAQRGGHPAETRLNYQCV